ncbi:hypothetical protein GCM10027456_28260 [Kineosporia babensis]
MPGRPAERLERELNEAGRAPEQVLATIGRGIWQNGPLNPAGADPLTAGDAES